MKKGISLSILVIALLYALCGTVAMANETRITSDPADQSSPDISGNRIVWMDQRNVLARDIYMYDLASNSEVQITTDPNEQINPKISGDWIVWADLRNGNYDIYMYDLATSTETWVATASVGLTNYTYPDISGSRIVWADYRNGNFDIYMYDILTGIETQITDDPADQLTPAISGDRIVWHDRRNLGQNIYLYDITSGTETALTNSPIRKTNPAISGDLVVWQDASLGYDENIYMYNLATSTQTQITTDTAAQWSPVVSGDKIVWQDLRNGTYDIYMYDLATGTETRITSDSDSQSMPAISEDRIVYTDNRNANYDIYLYRLVVNTPPVLETVGSSWVYEGNELIINLRATDPDGDPITYDVAGLPSGSNFDYSHGVFSWTPNHSQEGQYYVTFTVSDGYLVDYETVTITVFDGDGPPIKKKKAVKREAEEINGKDEVSFIADELESTFDMLVSFENLYPEKSDVTATTFEECPRASVGFQVDNACFDIVTDAISFDYVEICVIYDDTTFSSEKNLHLEHFENNHWVDITTSFDADANLICGISTTLSPFLVLKSVGEITAPADPQPLNTLCVASAEFVDQDIDRTHRAEINWGDGVVSEGVVNEVDGRGTASGSHVYAAAGVYTLILTVYDELDILLGESVYQYVVVFDPDAGFVTGGGWIYSPEGAYVADPTLTGKANFGFVSKYKKGAIIPTGTTEFQFKIADLNFHSENYEWLVVSGSNYAKFKGVGTINGDGFYKFQIWAGDGTGSNGSDTFRIKIWLEDELTGDENVVYDNGSDQDIAGGSMVVHTKK